ncbi:hypothetical protein MMC07_004670 [Pseudocyphellaria aurata]|nr:hypothetical protein [Pseudocyphellaria aurata]
MSTLGSSVINKSGKKFAPKAPIRRAAASASTQNSARASVDRQNLSQTPQPQSQTQSQPQWQPQTQPQPRPQPQPQPLYEIQSQLPLQPHLWGLEHPSQHASPRKGSLETALYDTREQAQSIVGAEVNAGPAGPQAIANREVGTESNSLSALTPSSSTQDTVAAIISSAKPDTTSLSVEVGGGDIITPAAKRRKIQERQQETSPISTASHTDVNVPLLSTETDRVAREAPEIPEAPSTIRQPRKRPQTAKAKKPQASSKEKVKEHKGKGGPDSKQPRKPRGKKLGSPEELNVASTTAEIDADAIQGSSDNKKFKRRRTRREATPEGAEDVRIVPSEMKMSDLCTNFRTGRKSAREVELEKLEKAELIHKKQRKQQQVTGEIDTSGQASESADQRLERLAREKGNQEEAPRAVPNTIIVDGQIQIDETSLQLDRHANAAEERDAEQLEGVDESELTRCVTQETWGKRDKSGSWNGESTDRFYDGLRMFGTDFGMISKLFPGRTRHSVKLKFCKEEKLDKQNIKRILLGERIPVDMEEYSKISKTTYADPRELERELEEDKKRMEAEHAAEKEAVEEIRRQREAEVAAESAAVGDDSTVNENRDGASGSASARRRKGKKAARAKKKSGQGQGGNPGGQEEVLEPIDEAARQKAVSVDI